MWSSLKGLRNLFLVFDLYLLLRIFRRELGYSQRWLDERVRMHISLEIFVHGVRLVVWHFPVRFPFVHVENSFVLFFGFDATATSVLATIFGGSSWGLLRHRERSRRTNSQYNANLLRTQSKYPPNPSKFKVELCIDVFCENDPIRCIPQLSHNWIFRTKITKNESRSSVNNIWR